MSDKGYHVSTIPKGVIGEVSKIQEEFSEFIDAHEQKISIMELVELSDLMGAIRLYLEKHHPSFKLDDLIAMNDVTTRAFKNGKRK